MHPTIRGRAVGSGGAGALYNVNLPAAHLFSMQWLTKLDQWMESAEKALVVFLFSSLVLLILLNIITRNLFDYTFQLISEIAPGTVLWLALVGSTLALKRNRHIKLEIFLRYTSVRVRAFARLLTGAIGLSIMGALFVASLEFVKNEVQIFGPGGWVAVVFPFFFALASFRYVLQIISCFRSASLEVNAQ